MQNKTKRNIKKMIIAACVMVSVVISSVTANADTKSPARTDSDFVVVAEADGNVDQAAVDRANELLNRLPVQVLKNFQNRGWRFLVTDKNIARTYYSGQYSSVQGMTDYDEKFVMVEQRSKAVEEATLHEFGHYLDWYYNKLSVLTALEILVFQLQNMQTSTMQKPARLQIHLMCISTTSRLSFLLKEYTAFTASITMMLQNPARV